MPGDKELSPENPRIDRWLEGVETAINEGTLCGSGETERPVSLRRRRQSCPSFLLLHPPSRDDLCDNSDNIEILDLARPPGHTRYFCPAYNAERDLTLPKVPKVSRQRSPRENNNKLEIIDLEKLRIETEFVRRKARQMETVTQKTGEPSDCHVAITESVNRLRFKNDKEERSFDEDSFKKEKPIITRYGTTGSINNNLKNPLTTFHNAPMDLKYQTNNPRAQTPTLSCRDKGKMLLPSLKNCDIRSETVHEVPSITVCTDGETLASKGTEQHLSLDPRFLMPTEASVDEARYLLATRRSSFPCIGRGMRRRSLDMVVEEQSNDPVSGDRDTASLSSLKVPRHRTRSRSLDNSLETSTNFTAFKESLRLRNVKKKVLGT